MTQDFDTKPPARAFTRRSAVASLLLLIAIATACGGGDDASTDSPASPSSTAATTTTAQGVGGAVEQRYPDVVDATAERVGDRWTFSATISSPYDTAERYADAWRVIAPDGTVLGVRELAHDHAAEQPFTRSLTAIAVPVSVRIVTIEARDLLHGWGGASVDIDLDAP